MPVQVQMTLATARTEVLARCGQLDDGGANPLLANEAAFHLNSAQRMLQREQPMLALQRLGRIASIGGQRLIELPADCDPAALQSVRWLGSNGIRWPISPKIDYRNQQIGGIPEVYELVPTQGIGSVTVGAGGTGYSQGAVAGISGGVRDADGTDPVLTLNVTSGVITSVTVVKAGTGWTTAPTLTAPTGTGANLTPILGTLMAIELWPVDSTGGTLEFEYRAIPVALVADGDLLAFDSEALVGRAAWLLAATKNLPAKADLLSAHNAYMSAIKGQQRPGGTFSLRRYDPPSEWMR